MTNVAAGAADVAAGAADVAVRAAVVAVRAAVVAVRAAGVELNGFGLWRTVDVRLFVLNETLDFGTLVPVGGPGTRGGIGPGRSVVPRGTIGDPAAFHLRNSSKSFSENP